MIKTDRSNYAISGDDVPQWLDSYVAKTYIVYIYISSAMASLPPGAILQSITGNHEASFSAIK